MLRSSVTTAGATLQALFLNRETPASIESLELLALRAAQVPEVCESAQPEAVLSSSSSAQTPAGWTMPRAPC